MWLLLTYLALALLGNAIIFFIGLAVEQVWPVASLPLYLFMFFLVLGLAWFGAVKLTEPKRAAPS